MAATSIIKPAAEDTRTEHVGAVFCPICTHTVPGTVLVKGRALRVKPGQRCSRCNSSLDPGVVVRLINEAA